MPQTYFINDFEKFILGFQVNLEAANWNVKRLS